MTTIRKQRTSDGCCTVFAGASLIVSGIDDDTADRLIRALKEIGGAGQNAGRSVGGRGFGQNAASPSRLRCSDRA